VLLLLQPLLNILLITSDPSRLDCDTIQALSKTHLESLAVLGRKEILDFLGLLIRTEAGSHNLNDRAEHAKSWWEFLDNGIPVVLGPLPKSFGTSGMGTESRDWKVDILLLDFAVQSKV